MFIKLAMFGQRLEKTSAKSGAGSAQAQGCVWKF